MSSSRLNRRDSDSSPSCSPSASASPSPLSAPGAAPSESESELQSELNSSRSSSGEEHRSRDSSSQKSSRSCCPSSISIVDAVTAVLSPSESVSADDEGAARRVGSGIGVGPAPR